ncbi:MAG: MgtC/SapB family protein [Marinobacterium sp.]|nr:MgtC/SapB family protein [Marinobacterium sp.]
MLDSQLVTTIPVLVAFAQGLLIGLERGWRQRREKDGARIAGFRTYGLLGLMGGFTGLLAGDEGLLVGLVLIAITLFLLIGHLIEMARNNDIGMTSLVAGILTFILGAAACRGYTGESAAATVLVLFLLNYKAPVHAALRALKPHELQATLKLLLISVVILPVLPNTGMGPWQAINPYQVWWMVVLISAISFCGYFAMRIVGQQKGALLTGLLAGLASSTALTLSFSRLAREETEGQNVLAASILVACGTMFPRILVVSTVLNEALLTIIAPPLLIMTAVIYGSAGLLLWRHRGQIKQHPQPEQKRKTGLKNPLDLTTALLFAFVLVVIMLLSLWLKTLLGDSGVLILSFLSGITDVDPITLTLSRMAPDGITLTLATLGILLAASVNSLVKGGLACSIAGMRFGLQLLLPLVMAVVLAALWVLSGGGVLNGTM